MFTDVIMKRQEIEIRLHKYSADKDCSILCIPKIPRTLKTTLDMDALLGGAEIEKFIKYFKSDITISLDNTSSLSNVQKPHEKIKCRKYFIYQTQVSTLPHMKLGTSSTRFGVLDIYIVFSNMKDGSKDLSHLVYNIFDTSIYASGMHIASALFIEKKAICGDI